MFNLVGYLTELKRNISKRDIFLILIIISCFFLTRIINLDKFPIFSDEGIYIHWSKVAWKDASWRFISLTDGRQPLQTWGIIPFLKIFETNALLAGRLFSVTGGLFALIGIIISGWYLLGKRVGFIAGFLYVFTPYFLFYDRLALVDSTMNAFTIWILLLSVLLGRKVRLDIALILGFVSGFGLLAKSSVKLYLGMAFFSILFILLEDSFSVRLFVKNIKSKLFKKPNKPYEIISFIFLYGVVGFLAVLMYNVQRLSPFFHFVSEKNKTFILTFSELLKNPLDYFSHNITNLPYYIFSETGMVFFVVAIVGLYFLYKKQKRIGIYFLIWLVGGMLSISLVARVLFPRYVLSLGGLMIIPAAYMISLINDKRRYLGIIAIFLLSVIYFNYTIIFDYKNIPLPKIDRGQYLEDWPAGWGIKEIVSFARSKSKEKPVILLAEGGFGMSGDVLDIYLLPGDKISIKSYWPLNIESLLENQPLLNDSSIYIVFSHRNEFPQDWPIKKIEEYKKPGGRSSMFLFELKDK